MHKELQQCIGELRVNHTDKEIAGALSEYFQIVKGVSYDYTDSAEVKDIRTDHPELGFMDDDEIKEILEQAEVMRRKREPDKDERLTMDDMKELFRRNKAWGDAGSVHQCVWIPLAAGNGMKIDELAAMVWVCTSPARVTMLGIKRTMREYLKEKREKERGSSGAVAISGYDVEFMETCLREHMDTFCDWPYGDVKKVEVDRDGNLRIHYTGGMYWHYKRKDEEIVWW